MSYVDSSWWFYCGMTIGKPLVSVFGRRNEGKRALQRAAEDMDVWLKRLAASVNQ
jgi:hypothetical protein